MVVRVVTIAVVGAAVGAGLAYFLLDQFLK
jgi:hypothetical protein